jgi:hypothetical protein
VLGAAGAGRRRAAAPPASERYALSLEIPGLSPGRPLWSFRLEMASEPQGEGERLRLRAHLQANFASGLAPALAAPAAEASGAAGRLPAARIGAALRAGLDHPLVRRLAEPLLRQDFNSWLELQASTADLVQGADALVPQKERLAALGVQLAEGRGPLAQSWAGHAGGAHPGFAQLSLLRLDKRDLPPVLARLLGTRPFQMAAAVVNVLEEKLPAKG